MSPFLALEQALRDATKPPPFAEGWRSSEEIAGELGVAPSTVANRLTVYRRAGRLEEWSGFCDNGSGRKARTTRYRVRPDRVA